MAIVLLKLLLGTGAQWLFGVTSYYYPGDAFVQRAFVVLVSAHGILVFASTLLQRAARREVKNFVTSVKSAITALL